MEGSAVGPQQPPFPSPHDVRGECVGVVSIRQDDRAWNKAALHLNSGLCAWDSPWYTQESRLLFLPRIEPLQGQQHS